VFDSSQVGKLLMELEKKEATLPPSGRRPSAPTPLSVTTVHGYLCVRKVSWLLAVRPRRVIALAEIGLLRATTCEGVLNIAPESVDALLGNLSSVAKVLPTAGDGELERGEFIRLASNLPSPANLAMRALAVLEGRLPCIIVRGSRGLSVSAVAVSELDPSWRKSYPHRNWLPTPQVSALLGCSPQAVRELIGAGYLTDVTPSTVRDRERLGHHYRVDRTSLEAFKADYTTGAELAQQTSGRVNIYPFIGKRTAAPEFHGRSVKVWRRSDVERMPGLGGRKPARPAGPAG
jgi:hypothetical protein